MVTGITAYKWRSSIAFGFNLTKFTKVVTNVYDATKGYIAQKTVR